MADDKDTATAPPAPKPVAPTLIRVVDSLLDAMVDASLNCLG
jgi:hypothetical protein